MGFSSYCRTNFFNPRLDFLREPFALKGGYKCGCCQHSRKKSLGYTSALMLLLLWGTLPLPKTYSELWLLMFLALTAAYLETDKRKAAVLPVFMFLDYLMFTVVSFQPPASSTFIRLVLAFSGPVFSSRPL